jgi:hypothetical protein
MTPLPAASAIAGHVTDQRAQALSVALPRHIELLRRRRAADVPQADVDGYIALGWMRWAAGRLVITPRGTAMRDTVLAREERDAGTDPRR